MIVKNYKKHNSVPVKQWSNVNYSFKRSNDKYLLYKNSYNKILNSYFALSKKVLSYKSKRMRNLIKRFSTIKLYNSEGGIKQNSDKINLTVYTFDREKSLQLKTLYSLNKSLSKINKYNTIKLKNINNIISDINSNYSNQSIDNNKRLSLKNVISALFFKNKITTRKRKILKSIKKNNIFFNKIYIKNVYKHNKKNNFKLKRSINLLKRPTKAARRILYKKSKIMIQNKRNLLYKKLINNLSWSFNNKKILSYKIMYLRLFYLYILKSLGISLIVKRKQNLFTLFYDDKIHNFNSIVNKLPNKFSLLEDTNKLYRLISKKINDKSIWKYNLKSKSKSNLIDNITKRNLSKITNDLKLERGVWINNKLEIIMNIALNTLINNKVNSLDRNTRSISEVKKILYKEFKINNSNVLFSFFFDKQLMIIHNIYKLFINNEKYTNLTNILKYGLNKLYNKKVFINLINLKYLHLSPSNLVDAIVIKLRNKNNNILKTMKRSMKLAKLGKIANVILGQTLSLGSYETKNNRKGTKFSSLINEMYNLPLTKFNETYYPSKKINKTINDLNINLENKDITKVEKNNKIFKNKTKEILRNLKHKWISGVKLEGKGRLTKRFTSSRSLFKYRAKGNLRTKLGFSNEDFLKLIKKGNKVYKKSPSVILSRGINVPSVQHVKKSGTRRIGSFGIKLWINNN